MRSLMKRSVLIRKRSWISWIVLCLCSLLEPSLMFKYQHHWAAVEFFKNFIYVANSDLSLFFSSSPLESKKVQTSKQMLLSLT